MAVRFDYSKLEIPEKPHITEDGMLLVPAVFAKPGVLLYRRKDGSIRRELRLPEENEKALTGFGLSPITNDHPPVLLSKETGSTYRKGITLQNLTGKGGYVHGQIAIFDSKTIQEVLDGKRELSPGYRCSTEEKPGVWIDEKGKEWKYDAIQRDLDINHNAIVWSGRAGSDVGIRLDSIDCEGENDIAYEVFHEDEVDSGDLNEKEIGGRMATIRIDGVEYSDIPEVAAAVMAAKLTRLDSIAEDSADLREELEQKEREALDEKARGDAAEYILGNAEEVLERLGFARTADGSYVKVDSSDEEEEEDDDEEEEEEEEEAPKEKKGKKGKLPPFMKKDSAKDLLIAFREADQIVAPDKDGNSFSDQHLDSLDSVAEIHRKVVEIASKEHFPNFRLDGKDESGIEVAYELIKDAVSNSAPKLGREDAIDHTGALSSAISSARKGSISANHRGENQGEPESLTANAWKSPLALSRR